MDTLPLSGDYFEMGHYYGSLLKSVGFVPPRANSANLRFASASFRDVRRFLPELAEEIEGIGFALKGNFRELLALVLTTNAISNGRCTVFAAGKGHTQNRNVVLARNYDKHYRHSGKYLRFKTVPKNALASIANTDIMVGREDGMNQAGLAIAGSEVPSKNVKPGIIHTLLIRGVLDRCSTVDEAVELLTKAKHARAMNYVIADRSGKFAYLEATSGATNAKVMKEGFVVATNHFQNRSMMDFEDVSQRQSDTFTRSKRVQSLIAGKKSLLDHNLALKFLSDHKENVCGHIESVGFNTVWSTVFSPADGIITTSDGHPCNSPYRQYRI